MSSSRESTSVAKLEEDVYLCQSSKPRSVGSREPTVVLILGWMGAQLRHLRKYAETYSELFPESTQVLVRCPTSHFYTLASSKNRKYRAVIDLLRDLGFFSAKPASGETPTILIHIFSNGGCMQYLSIASAMEKFTIKKAGYVPVPWSAPGAMVFDSCPGGADIPSAIRAFTAPAPIRNSRPLYLLIAFFVFVGCVVGKLAMLLHLLPSFTQIQDRMLNAFLLPRPFHGLTGKGMPRLYAYSRADALVPFNDVQAEVREARKRGLDAREEIFEKSAHVLHAREEPERYWGAVKDLWAHAIRDD